MDYKKPVSARPKFVGYWLLALVMPLDVVNLLVLGAHGVKSFLSVALLGIPATYFVARCLTSQEPDLANLISLSEARTGYVLCLMGALIFLLSSGVLYATPGFLAAYSCSVREPFVRNLLCRFSI